MTTNEMAQKGFNTGFTDADGNELHVGDYVRLCGDIGEIVFSCGAFGIFIVDEVPWDALEELVRKDSGNRPSFLYNDNFISFWEIVWNLSEDSDEPCLPHVKSVTATGGIFTDEEGNKDVFMGCISSCFATLTQCEHTCGRYYTCDTVAMANVSRSKQEIDLVANGMEAMGLSIETGYFDPDDEPTDDVPKQLMGFYYVRMSAEA